MVTVEWRAAVHAALGEPVRLAIVDRLGPGDASPGELGDAVGLGSNLLAHHLKVLDEAGVIQRVRSAAAAGRRHGLRLGRVKPVAIEQVLRDGNLVVAVCDNVHEQLDPSRDRLHWSIPDPVRVDTDKAFETAYADIPLA